MLSLIEVKCPHCGAQGQIVLPPLGAIIVGPCPQCEEPVVVFCGRVLPLKKSVIQDGSMKEKYDHLMAILTQFVEQRVTQLLKNAEESQEPETDAYSDEEMDIKDLNDGVVPDTRIEGNHARITQAEVDQFTRIDLKFLDNKDYFNEVFG